MNKSKRKPIIGILGGVGSGKSTVAEVFAKLGCAVIDADEIAHKVLDKKDLRNKVTCLFGRGILGRGGKISRRKLAGVVFSDFTKIAALNKILHPLVLKEVRKLIDKANRKSEVSAIVLDMPLLTEVGWAERCDRLIFVKCSQRLRAERSRKKGIFSIKMLKSRENFQISLDKKEAIADNTIDNNSGFPALAGQVIDIFSSMMGK